MNRHLRELYSDLDQLPIELVSELEGGLVCLSMIPESTIKSFILRSFLSDITFPTKIGKSTQYWTNFMEAVKSSFEKGIGWTPNFVESDDLVFDLGRSWMAGFVDIGSQIGVEWNNLIMNPINGTTMLPLLVWVEDTNGNPVTTSTRIGLSELKLESMEQIPTTLQWIYDNINW